MFLAASSALEQELSQVGGGVPVARGEVRPGWESILALALCRMALCGDRKKQIEFWSVSPLF